MPIYTIGICRPHFLHQYHFNLKIQKQIKLIICRRVSQFFFLLLRQPQWNYGSIRYNFIVSENDTVQNNLQNALLAKLSLRTALLLSEHEMHKRARTICVFMVIAH